MGKQIKSIILLLCVAALTNCSGQTKTNIPQNNDNNVSNALIGGGCDGCELMFVGIPNEIPVADTSAGWNAKGQKLFITGTVYEFGGKKPAANVIIYYWQTDIEGYYSPKAGMDEEAKRHGHIRGWVKSDNDGNYSIYTNRPAPYPNNTMPAHIHLSIKETNIKDEYYIDEFVFDDDILLTAAKRKALKNRGGSGVLRVLLDGEKQVAEHNIILGLNIPNYPAKKTEGIQSGREIGEDNPSFTPFHAYGPDKGTKTCPVCKYGRYHGIIYYVGNQPNWNDIKKWLNYLEKESLYRSTYLKVYFVYGNSKNYSHNQRRKELEKLGGELNLKRTALTFVPTFSDVGSEVYLNKINPEVESTFVIYKNRTIIDKFIDLSPTKENFDLISKTLDKTRNAFFDLSEPPHD